MVEQQNYTTKLSTGLIQKSIKQYFVLLRQMTLCQIYTRFTTWYNDHAPLCEMSQGSANSMESEDFLHTAIKANMNMDYTTVVSDGDTKTVANLNSAKVYGDTKRVKEECINHITKKRLEGLIFFI